MVKRPKLQDDGSLIVGDEDNHVKIHSGGIDFIGDAIKYESYARNWAYNMYASSETWDGQDIDAASLYDTPSGYGLYRNLKKSSYRYGARVPIFTTPKIDPSKKSIIRIILAPVESGYSEGDVKLRIGLLRQSMNDGADGSPTWYDATVHVDGTQWKFYKIDLELNLGEAPYMMMFYRDSPNSADTYGGDMGVFYTAVICPINKSGKDKESV